MPYDATPVGTIECIDCGYEYETIRNNTKRCSVCQLIESMRYGHMVGLVDRECLCGQHYHPLAREDRLCGTCTPRSRRTGVGRCGFCHEERPFIRVDVAVCNECARDTANRPALFRALLRKQAQRKEESHGRHHGSLRAAV